MTHTNDDHEALASGWLIEHNHHGCHLTVAGHEDDELPRAKDVRALAALLAARDEEIRQRTLQAVADEAVALDDYLKKLALDARDIARKKETREAHAEYQTVEDHTSFASAAIEKLLSAVVDKMKKDGWRRAVTEPRTSTELTPELFERAAEAIYRHEACDPESVEAICGQPLKAWKTNAPWDSNPDELAEHQRDDYRRMARAALAAVGFMPDTQWSRRVLAIYEAAYDLCGVLVDKGVHVVGAETALLVGQISRRLADALAAAPPSLIAAFRDRGNP